MENNKSKILWGLAIGAAAGFVIGYLLSGKKMNEISDDLSNMADKFKSKVSETIDKSKEEINEIKENIDKEISKNA